MGASAAELFIVAAASYAASSSASGNPKAPKIAPPTQTGVAQTSAYKAGMMNTGQSGGAAGVSQTFLTGPSGVDPSMLNIGRNTLLGG